MEHRYPVRLEEFRVRKNSGGKGKWNGGESGKSGNQKVIRKNGEIVELDSIQNINLKAGDKFIKTPGGGGFGKPKNPNYKVYNIFLTLKHPKK